MRASIAANGLSTTSLLISSWGSWEPGICILNFGGISSKGTFLNMSNLFGQEQQYSGVRRGCGGGGARIIIAIVLALVAVIGYYSSKQTNPVTGEVQHIKINAKQEIALGLQATPQMEQQYGGESNDAEAVARVQKIGNSVVQGSDAAKGPYTFDFHLLADQDVINAFALPGGQVFITDALYRKLTTDGEVAGVLGHEIGHVIGRHGAEQLAKSALTSGLAGAAVIGTYDPNHPGASQTSAMVAAAVANLVNLKYGRNDENEADGFGVKYMSQAGYDPRSMLKVMEILRDSSKGGHQPEFFSTHPDPGNRLQHIQAVIDKIYPGGVPNGLKP
jgi:predicted Zn-dependent protease